MASFSNEAKTEICAGVKTPAARRAFLTGVLLAARRFSADEIALQTECDAFAALLPKLLQTADPKCTADTEYRTRSNKVPVWCFTVSGAQNVSRLRSALRISPEHRAAALNDPYTLQMIAAGVFVVCGSVTDPERDFHLEFAIPDAEFGRAFQQALSEMEQPAITLKSTARKGDLVLYLKQNEQIGDLLAFLGAQEANFTIIHQHVLRSIIGQTNRRTNCDMANIDKAVAAGIQQTEEIRLIERTIGLDALPEVLQEAARARLAEPEANLRDLGAMLHPPISRSGLHHRMQRISEIAAKIQAQEDAESNRNGKA